MFAQQNMLTKKLIALRLEVTYHASISIPGGIHHTTTNSGEGG